MSDHEALVRVAILQSAILHELQDADSETRDQLREILHNGGNKITVWDGKTELGHVRRNKPSVKWRVVDQNAYQGLLQQGGEWVDPATGEVHEVAGVAEVETEGALVVEAADGAKSIARRLLGK